MDTDIPSFCVYDQQEYEAMGEVMRVNFNDFDAVLKNFVYSREPSVQPDRCPVAVDEQTEARPPRKKRAKKVHALPQSEIEAIKFPNVSRKRRNVMYAFPSFDKCDSLVFFPNTFSKHLNAGDFPALSKLLQAHLHRSCDVSLCSAKNLTVQQMLKVYQFLDSAYPDSIMCVHHTKVIENEIHAVAYSKYTHCRGLLESTNIVSSDEAVQRIFGGHSAQNMNEKMKLYTPEPVRSEIITSLNNSKDFVIFTKIIFKLVFDAHTGKGLSLEILAEVTSLTSL